MESSKNVTDSPQNVLEQLEHRYQELKDRIAKATRQSKDQTVDLVAVSKGHTSDKIRKLFELGQRRFGENYYQELLKKQQDLSDLPIEWVFIGHLQSNKIKKIVQVASEIQTVASLKHAAAIAAAARQFQKTPYPIYIAVNADEEEQKNGVSFQELPQLYQALTEKFPDELEIQGIMAVPSAEYASYPKDKVPPVYQRLGSEADNIGRGRLSLGMSGDLEIAILAGSNLVRIGTDLMGTRQ